MALHPQCKIILDLIDASTEKPLEQMSAVEARLSRAQSQEATVALAGPALPVARVEDRVIDTHLSSIPIRVYWPAAGRLLPVLVCFRGGGWVLGNLDIMDRPCRALANAAGCIVVSVNYRLAPEYKFPAALEDAYRAVYVSGACERV